MSIKMILFDKDGTLMDFDAFWIPVSRGAVTELLEKLGADPGLAEPLMVSLGVQDGVADVQGVLCGGTYGQMGERLWETLCAHGVSCETEEVEKLTRECWHRHLEEGEIRPACADLKKVLGGFIRLDIQMALITTDSPRSTRNCLEALEIGPYFTAVCTDNGMFPPKPDPLCIEVICEQFGLTKDEVVMVGDTMTDVLFARNGGIRVIGVGKTEVNRAYLQGEADAVVEDISHVADVVKAL